MPNQLSKIKYVVQLMLENRSFDQMLGFLYSGQGRPRGGMPFEGLTGEESNPGVDGEAVLVGKVTNTSANLYRRPGADPGEGFYNTNLQLFSTQHPTSDAVATNQGFITNFQVAIAYDAAHHYSDSLPGTVAADIMQLYTPEVLPVMSALAKGFAVCDQWFASAPTQTIPNRAFASAGTSQGHLDNAVKIFTCPSIFGRFTDAGLDWAIYGYNSAPLARTDFPDTLHADESHFGRFTDFQQRAAKGTLPPYTFLEPSFGASGNSQHPNYDVSKGEQLLNDVYRTLRDGPGWNETLLIITYDEHGGNYDHVVPPTNAIAPDDSVGEFDNFNFQRYGVRIPALLISPLIPAGTVFRANEGTIDHTSVLKTLEQRWNLPPLTRRDANAPGLGDVLSLDTPRADDPLKNLIAPKSIAPLLAASAEPSELEQVLAWRLSKLPIPNADGSFGHVLPTFKTGEEIGEYIAQRSAAWTQHLEQTKVSR